MSTSRRPWACTLYLSFDEYEALKAVAKKDGIAVSTLMSRLALRIVKDQTEKADEK